jgi:hypothetical protein
VRLSTQNQFRQTPEIYSIQGFEEDVLHTFFDCGQAERKFSCYCYLKKNAGWVIDAGAIHGVSAYSGPVIIEVEAGMQYEAPVLKVGDTYTQIDIGLVPLDEKLQYHASLRSYLSGNTTFFIEHPDATQMKGIVEQANGYLGKQKVPFVLTEDIGQASYIVRSNQIVIQICHNDELYRPATEILLSETEVSGKALRAMHHMGQWEYIRALSNPDFNEVHYPIQFDISFLNANGSKMPVSAVRDTVEFRYEKDGKGNDFRRMKVSLRNTSSRKYFCSVLYLSNTFQVYGNMLDNKVVGLAPGQIAWALNGKEIELDLEPHVIKYNYPYSTFYLKLVAGPEPFAVEMMELSPLPAPGGNLRRGESGGDEMIGKEVVKNIPWFTRTLCFKGINPYYNPKSAE